MKLPQSIDARWIKSLTDLDLLGAERTLHATFAKQELAEKKKRGAQYNLLRGPEELTSAWLRWSMVCNATRDRGLKIRNV
jgi:hypothetical protein